MKQKDIFLIIDSHALIHRAFHAFPPDLRSAAGEPTNAVYGFAGLLLDVLLKFNPKKVVAVFDSHGPTVRSTEYTQYKANRAETDDLLIVQFPMVYRLVEMFDIPIIIQDGIEADDLIGSLDGRFSNEGMQTIIVTGDRDLLQLVDSDTSVYLAGSSFSQSKLYDTVELVKEKMGVEPVLIPDLKGLSGDTSDNIPGVAGIGAKGAVDLITSFGSIEEIYTKLDQVPNRYKQKLIDGHEDAVLSKRLATIFKDIPISFNFSNSDFLKLNKEQVRQYFKDMQFKSLAGRLEKLLVNFQDEEVVTEELGLFATDVENESIPVDEAEVLWSSEVTLSNDLYLLLTFKGKDIGPTEIKLDNILVLSSEKLYKVEKESIQKFLDSLSKDQILYCIDKKSLLHSLINEHYNDWNHLKFIDVGIAAYIFAEGESKYDLPALLNWAQLKFDNSPKSLIRGLCSLHKEIVKNKEELDKKQKLIELEDAVLLPTVSMEQNGITVDLDRVSKFSLLLQEKIKEFELSVYQAAGHEFNINSPKQVSHVLFIEKGLPVNRKTKGGSLSTNEQVLKSLVGVDPIAENLLAFRELDKLINTYLTPIPTYVDKFGKIHCTLDQFGAVSGRFSSKNPNLQNIPFNEVYGVNIRNVFRSSEGYKFISLDYSQQELRILAALSGEEIMKESFNNNLDIHKITAAELFGVDIEGVDSKQRQVGKTINFSVIYGISAFGLSERLGVSRVVADSFIKKYFDKYPKVSEFMGNTLNGARELGYTETVMGRRRKNKLINSQNRALKNAAERELFNFVIQGSAADIMKLAMSRLLPVVEKYGARLILQIHDEFLFEFPDSVDDSAFVEEVSSIMLQAFNLGVVYKVEVSSGKYWGDL